MLTLLLSYLARASARGSPLGDALSDSIFYSFGVAHANSTYAYVPFSVSYMEPDNISTPNTGWGVGKYEYLYEVVNPAPAAACASPPMIPYDVPCCDFGEVVLDEDDVTVCASLCCGKPGCTGFTYEPASDGSFGGCIPGKPCCYMKNGWAAPVAKPAGFRILSANVTSGAQFVAPALGLRSAPPLGGVSTGSLELRADGSFHEWLINNQHPAGSSKWAVLDDAWLAVSVGPTARLLRTAPPGYAAGLGVGALNFSGSYPLTRLRPLDGAFPADAANLSLHAYSTYFPGDLAASAVPAVAFTLSVANTGPSPLPLALALNLPLGGALGCTRVGDRGGGAAPSAGSPAACLHACARAPACASWNFDPRAAPACVLNGNIPLTAFDPMVSCGVAGGGWAAAGGALALQWRGAGGGGAGGPSVGDVTLLGSWDGDLAPGASVATFAAGDDPRAVFDAFAAGGGAFSPGSAGLAAAGATFDAAPAAHGAAAVAGVVAPGGAATLTVVFAWSFPNRDWNGGPPLGNGYAAEYPTSGAAAAALGGAPALLRAARAINAHHRSVAALDNPTPIWLKDMLLNQFSHAHMLLWFGDGRLREYEAFSCKLGNNTRA